MEQANFIELALSCVSWQEAHVIADELLSQHLVACVEFLPIKSKYWWKQVLEEAEEIKLIMQSVRSNFTKIDEIVTKLHNYETPSLHATPIAIISEQARTWLFNTTQEAAIGED
jgi:periplasmic divalent cation tolerance protein